jgi:hypothetical protein
VGKACRILTILSLLILWVLPGCSGPRSSGIDKEEESHPPCRTRELRGREIPRNYWTRLRHSSRAGGALR